MAASDIIVKFGADLTALKAGFSEANKGTGDFESRMKSMGSTATAAGGMMTAGLTVPIMAVAAFAMKSASDVGGAFKTIEKSTGATGAQLNVLKGSFRDVFGNFPISADAAAQVVSKVSTTLQALNGNVPATQAQITAVSGAFEQFAKVGGVDVTTATDTLMRSFKAMGMSADDVKPALNDITIAAQSTGDNTQRLIDSVAKGAPTFKSFGFGIEDTSAMMAKIDMSGVKSTSVITGLNKVLKQAATDGIAPKKAFADINDELIKGTHTTPEATALYKELGVKGYAQLSIAAKGGAFDVQALTDKMADNQGAMEKSYNDTLTFGDRLTMFRNKLEIAFQPLGSAIFDVLGNLLDTLTPILNIVTGLAMKFSDMPKGIQTIVVIIGGLLAALGPVLLIVGKLMTSFEQIRKTLSTLAPMAEKLATPLLKAAGGSTSIVSKIPGLSALGGEGAEGGGIGAGLAESLAPIMPLLAPILVAVAAIAAVFAVLYATSQTFRTSVGALLAQFESLVGWVKQLVGDLMSGNFSKFGADLVSGLQGGFNTLKNDILGFPAMMITAIGESVTTIGGIADKVGGMFMSAFNTLHNIDWGGIFAGALDAVAKFLDTLLNFDPGPMIDSLINVIGGAFDSLFGGASGGAAPAAGSKGDIGGHLSKSVEKAGPDILGKLGNVFIKLLALLPTIWLKVAEALASALGKIDWGTVFAKIGSLIAGILGPAISGALGGAGNFIGTLFGGAGDAIKKFLGDLASSVGTYLGGFGQWIWNAIITVFKLDVKLWTWLANTVKTYAGGFGQWIWNAVISAFKFDTKLFDAVKTAFSAFGTYLWGLVSGLGDKLKTNVWDKLSQFGTWLIQQVSSIGQKIKDWIWSPLAAFGNWLIQQVSAIGHTIWGWITGAVGTFGTWLINLASGIGHTIWGWISGAVGIFGSWLGGLVGGIGHTIWNAITSAVNTFGSWLGGLVGGIGGTIKNSIWTALGSFGSWLLGLVPDIGGKIYSSITGVQGQISASLASAAQGLAQGLKDAWNAIIPARIGISVMGHDVGIDIPRMWQGGVIPATEGGRLFIAGEGHEPEVLVPGHRVGEEWDSLLNGPNRLPHLAGGAVIGGVPAARTTGSMGGTNDRVASSYHATVVVDSEDIVRKMFRAFKDHDDFVNLGR